MPSLLFRPALAPHDGRSGSESFQSHDSYYSDEDIRILNEIVTTAQSSLDGLPERERLPTNALFRAYDSVLPTYGLDPEGDQHLSRLVFRIGGERGEASLQDKFRAVLSRMGIKLVLDTPTVSVHSGSDDETIPPTQPFATQSGPDSRRSSNEFSHDIVSGGAEAIIARIRSLSLADAGEDESEQPDSPGVTYDQLLRQQNVPQYQHAQGLIKQRMSPSLAGETELSQQSPHSALDSEVNPGASDTTAQTLDDVDDPDSLLKARLEELEERARRFEEYHVAVGGLRLLRDWHVYAAYARTKRSELDAHADANYRGRLLAATFSDWDRYASQLHKDGLDKAEAAKREARHKRLNKIATRAREIFLVARTFSIWQDHAADVAERTAVARRHILRLRHFDSWKDVALVQEHLMRAFVQSTYFSRWEKQYLAIRDLEGLSVHTRNKKLAERTFRDWHLLQLDHTAELHRANKVKDAFFRQWLSASRVEDAESLSATHLRDNAMGRIFRDWRTRAKRKKLEVDEKLVVSHQRHTTDVFQIWKSESSRRHQVGLAHDMDLIGDVLEGWNAEAKCRHFRQQADTELLSETFKDWVAVQRMEAFRAERDRRLMEDALVLFRLRSKELEAQDNYDTIRARASYACRTSLAKNFNDWRRHSERASQIQAMVQERRSQTMKVELLNAWFDLSSHNQELDRWADRGGFYMLAVKCVEDWKAGAKAERERKLRALYAQGVDRMRRTTVSRCWALWKHACESTDATEHMADMACRVQVDSVRSTTVEIWRSKSSRIADLDRESEDMSRALVANSLLGPWKDLTDDYTGDYDFAAREERARNVRRRCLESWALIFQRVEGQEFTASNAKKRVDAKRVQELFGTWKAYNGLISKAGEEYSNPDVGNLARSDAAWPARRQRIAPPWSRSDMLEYKPRQGAGTEGHDQDLGHSIISMNTPTRWTGLARSVNAMPSTTPMMPLATPYERELRARYENVPPSNQGARSLAAYNSSRFGLQESRPRDTETEPIEEE